MSDQPLDGGHENAGQVVRVGDTIRRPRTAGHEVVEALLEHLESVGFAGAPRFLGVDDLGRQIVDYVPGEAVDPAPWAHDDETNARQLGQVARWLATLHEATATFVPPAGAQPRRQLPLPGTTWTHGDLGYGNLVFDEQRLVGAIDWEFAAPGHRCTDLAALLGMSIRGPRPDATDPERRARAAGLAFEAIVAGYGLATADAAELPTMAADRIDDAVAHWELTDADQPLPAWRWRSAWLREHAATLPG